MTPDERKYWTWLEDPKRQLAFERRPRKEKAELVAAWLKNGLK